MVLCSNLETNSDLRTYQERLREAERHDHRRLSAELDFFSFLEEIGPGLVVFHPKGAMLHHEIENHVTRRHMEYGFDFVHTPKAIGGVILGWRRRRRR